MKLMHNFVKLPVIYLSRALINFLAYFYKVIKTISRSSLFNPIIIQFEFQTAAL